MKKSAIFVFMFLGFCGAAQATGLGSLAVNAAELMKAAKAADIIPMPRLAPAEEPGLDFSLEVFNHVCAKESAALAKLGLDAKARAYGFDSGDLDLESMIVEGMTREGGFIYTLTGYIYKGEYFITVVTDSSCAAEAVTIKERLDGEAMAPAQQAFRKTGIDDRIASIDWVAIHGGSYQMGIDTGYENSWPRHRVSVNTFRLAKTHVTVEQYAECVTKGKCGEPGTGEYCNWGVPGYQKHPVNCVSWHQANQYAGYKGARLPTEAEWEYAATGGGKSQNYPWGNNAPAQNLVAMGSLSTMPVCSRPAGNTAQGLCDMTGNGWQWLQDSYKGSYHGAPADGSAVAGQGPNRAVRGGGVGVSLPKSLSVYYRAGYTADYGSDIVGFRLAK